MVEASRVSDFLRKHNPIYHIFLKYLTSPFSFDSMLQTITMGQPVKETTKVPAEETIIDM